MGFETAAPVAESALRPLPRMRPDRQVGFGYKMFSGKGLRRGTGVEVSFLTVSAKCGTPLVADLGQSVEHEPIYGKLRNAVGLKSLSVTVPLRRRRDQHVRHKICKDCGTEMQFVSKEHGDAHDYWKCHQCGQKVVDFWEGFPNLIWSIVFSVLGIYLFGLIRWLFF